MKDEGLLIYCKLRINISMKKSMNLLLMAVLAVGLGMNLTSCKEGELTEEEKQQQAQ